jgi:hypothetical protein
LPGDAAFSLRLVNDLGAGVASSFSVPAKP